MLWALHFCILFLVQDVVWAQQPEVGFIEVSSEPGIQVFLDGELQGVTSAKLEGLIIDNVPSGSHRIKAVKKGFGDQEMVVQVVGGKVLRFTVQPWIPTLAPKKGDLIIQSLPIGCHIEIKDLKIAYDKKLDEWKVGSIPVGTYHGSFRALGEVVEGSFNIEEGVITHLFVNIPKRTIEAKRRKAEENNASAGEHGGESSFFGIVRPGIRTIYIVDFSLSMTSEVTKAVSRIAALKKELIRSINALNPQMAVSVIFFSHNAWSIDAEGQNPADSGWNGLGKVPFLKWYPAIPKVKTDFVSKISNMSPSGNTRWYAPLKMALAMDPPPDTVYLLSDGEPSDYDQVINEIDEINPNKTPVDTIAFELPGTPAKLMMKIAEATGGKFTVIFKGRAYRGQDAENLTKPNFDGKE